MPFQDILDLFRLPHVSINLMFERTAENDPFYAHIVQRFYDDANSRHPKFIFAKKIEYGFTLCKLPKDFDTYYMAVEAAARRNHKKAIRLGCEMKRFNFNDQLDGIRDIWLSTPMRQGELLPQDIREGRVSAITDPPSKNPCHDYPYFGVFKKGELVAYAGCLVAGESCNITDIYGHARYQSDGVVPLLIIEIARELMTSFRTVKYYSYGTYFGASESMRRFKRKFLFEPYRVSWVLGSK